MKQHVERWTALLLVLSLCIAAVACSRTVTGAPVVAGDRGPSELDRLLLSDAQISTIMGTGTMATYRTYTDIPVQPGENYSHPECAVALFNTTVPAYEASDYVRTLGKKIAEPASDVVDVDQAVVAFQSASEAQSFVNNAKQVWQSCAGMNVTYTGTDRQEQPWTLGTPRTVGEIIAITNESRYGWFCGHAMATKSNVVVDVDACGYDITDEAIDIVKAITTVAE